MAQKFDVYQEVTDQILAEMEAGTPPWRKPWTGDVSGVSLPERWNGEGYNGINVLLLWVAASRNNFVSSRWMTYRQAQELGGNVRRGEKSSTSIKFGTIEREDDAGDTQAIPYARAFRVFNADQIEGLAEEFYRKVEPARDLGTETDPEMDAWVSSIGADVRTSDEPRAYYQIKEDFVHMPPVKTFHNAAGYYGTLLHELSHWTGHAGRLDRFQKFEGKSEYAAEELVAEISACMLAVRLGVEPQFDQSAAYVEGWIEAMRADKRAIFRAAADSQRATDFLMSRAAAKLAA